MALVALEDTLSLVAPFSEQARLWRDFAFVLRDSEDQEPGCPLPGARQSRGLLRLRPVLTGRLLAHSPALAGLVFRRITDIPPGIVVDCSAHLLARALE